MEAQKICRRAAGREGVEDDCLYFLASFVFGLVFIGQSFGSDALNTPAKPMNGERKTVAVEITRSGTQVTELLTEWSAGDQAALEKLTPLVYGELRRIAHRYMGSARPDHTLQTTALVNEAYLRLAEQAHPNWKNRAHFLAVAARAMRQILVNYAMSYNAQKRGGGAQKVELDEVALVAAAQSKEVIELNEALERLGKLDARKAQVVELKYFGGLNQDEIASVLTISAETVRREWRFAKAWLLNELQAAV
jgi:RNA polymerase sigma-70 factor, ECF subfamily